jgi:hypothetical protein
VVDAGENVNLHCDLRVQLSDPNLAPGLLVRRDVAPQHVFEESHTQGVIHEPGLAGIGDVGAALARAQRLDGLQEEVHGHAGIHAEVGDDPRPQAQRQRRLHVGVDAEQEEDGVERAHDDEGEPCLVVGEVDELLLHVEGVGERAVALPGVEGAVRVAPTLLRLLARLDRLLLRLEVRLRERGGSGGSRGGLVGGGSGRRILERVRQLARHGPPNAPAESASCGRKCTVAAPGVKAAGDAGHHFTAGTKMTSNFIFGARGVETHTGVIDP